MGRQRATNMKNNRKVFMPGPAPPRVEAGHCARMEVWQREFGKYMKNNCNNKGEQNESNLTITQQLALKRLSRRVSKNEIVILESDKGKRFVIVSEEVYKAMGRNHTRKYSPATTEEIRASQRVLSTAAKAMINMFGVGKSHSYSNYSRCFDNAGSAAEDVPTMKILPKIHKAATAAGHPQSCPVVTAASGLSSRSGDILSDFLGPIILLNQPRMEDQSTGEVLSQLEDAATAIEESGYRDIMVGSLDVQALYPSLDQKETAKIVGELVMESRADISGVDYRSVPVFVASNMDQEEIKREGLTTNEIKEKKQEAGPNYR